MKVVVVGYGSIAKKHLAALNALGIKKDVYLLRSKFPSKNIDNYTNIYSYDDIPHDFDFVIISNPTSKHKESLVHLIPFEKPILLEKPPLQSTSEEREIRQLIKQFSSFIFPAFNLRFHPLINWLMQNIDPSKIIEAQVYCGSYLPDWREGTDYRRGYSARKELGGGVHLDLIHEIDYVTYLLGFPNETTKFLSKKSQLEIDSYDCAHYWLEYDQCNVSITLNYYRREPRRTIEIVMSEYSLDIDLIEGKIFHSQKGLILQSEKIDLQLTYIDQMDHFLRCISGECTPINTLDSALKTLSICQ